jgi:superfamily II DNA or RNA helicase
MLRPDRFIASCASWSEFWEGTKRLSSAGDKGAAFERLTQLYLQTVPEYQSELAHIWTLREVPPHVRKLLALPALDEGIDFIARTRHGKYWAIQSKFRSRHDKPLTRRELGTFSSLAFNTCSNIELAVVAHTASKPVSKHHLMRNTTEIGLDRWQSLDQEAWSLIVRKLKGRNAAPKARMPKPHQSAAVAAAKAHFVRGGATRGRLIMPCGTGKSLTAYWIAEALNAKTILVTVPSLALVRQSLADWTREFLAHGIRPDWLCVCSDETVGNLERDEFVGEVYDLGLPTHTDTKEIAAQLRARSSGPKIVFTTYQSSAKLAAAARKARLKFDLAILDEAHKTVGVHSKTFASLLSDKKIKIQRRVFMTATERLFRGERSDVLSMDDEKNYGARFFQLSFKEAINQKLITDYKILTMTVSDSHIRGLIDQNHILNLNSRDLDEAEAQAVAAGIALKRIYKRHGVKHAISFHRSIHGADRFREQQDAFNRTSGLGPKTTNLHISSKKTAGQRSELLREFVGDKHALMTNARCLTEGVDVPAIDCVMFADPKQSRVDIVQAAGRALRRHEGKDHGYIVVPVVVPEKMDFDKFAETTAFKQVAQTITALSIQDERIADEFRAIEQGHGSSGKIVEIEGDIPVGMKMKLGDFAQAISTRVWESVGRANWRPFAEAQEFAQALGLSSHIEWWKYSTGRLQRSNLPDLPPDIPATPDRVYHGDWKNWADWLGHRRRIGGWRPFQEARKYARGLKLSSNKEWVALAQNGKLPDDIPAYPNNVYKEWIGWWDWLGTRHRRGEWLPFARARTLARKLGLKSQAEFIRWRRGLLKCEFECPPDMPMHPDRTYADFVSWPDFLDFTPVSWLPFDQARNFVRRQNLKSQLEYKKWAKGLLVRPGLLPRPINIPTNPNVIYADEWQGFNDFIGTPKARNIGRVWRPLKSAREFVRPLGLSNYAEYLQWSKGLLKDMAIFPDDLPADLYGAYKKEKDWKGVSDFLGSKPSGKYVKMWPFEKSRTFVQKLNLQSSTEYFKWANGGLQGVPQRPPEIPIVPRSKYRTQWRSWDDWLGLT